MIQGNSSKLLVFKHDSQPKANNETSEKNQFFLDNYIELKRNFTFKLLKLDIIIKIWHHILDLQH